MLGAGARPGRGSPAEGAEGTEGAAGQRQAGWRLGARAARLLRESRAPRRPSAPRRAGPPRRPSLSSPPAGSALGLWPRRHVTRAGPARGARREKSRVAGRRAPGTQRPVPAEPLRCLVGPRASWDAKTSLNLLGDLWIRTPPSSPARLLLRLARVRRVSAAEPKSPSAALPHTRRWGPSFCSWTRGPAPRSGFHGDAQLGVPGFQLGGRGPPHARSALGIPQFPQFLTKHGNLGRNPSVGVGAWAALAGVTWIPGCTPFAPDPSAAPPLRPIDGTFRLALAVGCVVGSRCPPGTRNVESVGGHQGHGGAPRRSLGGSCGGIAVADGDSLGPQQAPSPLRGQLQWTRGDAGWTGAGLARQPWLQCWGQRMFLFIATGPQSLHGG